MDLPHHRDIRFTTTDDGIGIAFWQIGSGPPIILIHNWSLCHLELEWTVPSIASFYIALAARYRLIRFDPRGQGLSDTAVYQRGLSASGAQLGLSTREMCFDISAVAEACQLDRFALMAVGSQGPVAIEFAAAHPQRLSALILCDTLAKVRGSFLDAYIQTQAALWDIERESGRVAVTMFEQLAPSDEIERWAALEDFGRQRDWPTGPSGAAMRDWDTSSKLAQVEAPTLVLASRSSVADVIEESRGLAAAIPGSQLRIVEGRFAPYVVDRPAVLDAIAALVRSEVHKPDVGSSRFRTIAFTDVVGSTEYLERVGDEAGRSALREVERHVVETAAACGGEVVKHLGDGSLVSFSSNSRALEFGMRLQRMVEPAPLQIRIGMAAGEPIEENGDIHGTVVAQASRIAGIGEAGEVVVSDAVRQLARGKGYEFEPLGEVTLKGFDDPMAVWKVRRR